MDKKESLKLIDKAYDQLECLNNITWTNYRDNLFKINKAEKSIRVRIMKINRMLFICATFALQTLSMSKPCLALEINLETIKAIESGGDPNAVGDHGKALGLYQLHADAVKDVNRFLGSSYSHKDALRPKIAYEMAYCYVNEVIPSYLRHYGLKDNLENRLTAYNKGIGAVRKGIRADKYIAKYKKLDK